MKLGEFIKNYRIEKGISQRQFAKQCNVSNGYISILEDGKRPKSDEPVVPTISTLKKIATAMGMTLHQLVDIVDYMPISLNDEAKKEEESLPWYNQNNCTLTPHEQAVIDAYRTQPEMQPAVNRLLGVPPFDLRAF